VIFKAEHRTEILDALKIAEELKLKAIISGGADAWKTADALKAAKVPVLIGGTLQLPTEPTDPYDAAYANPARLFEAGIAIAIHSNEGGPEQATAARNLPYEAATAVAFGLPESEALKAVTLAPAQILGVADQVGSLEAGKRANLVITAGHILQPTTDVKALFIGGKPIAPESAHTARYAEYQHRLAEVRAGTAALGLDPVPAASSAPSPSGPAPAVSPPLTGPNPPAANPPARRE
jgi:imidazolonepropionase-like amidohydrolase